MKIKTKKMSYEEVVALPRPKHHRPLRPNILFRTIIRIASIPDLLSARVQVKKERMELAGKGPWLILMNHSSFIDLKVASKIFYPKPFCIVSTTDSYVGKSWLMRLIGCIPTQKFVSDLTLIRDILYAIKTKKASVLMYPEAGYSFDGKATVLPRKLGVLLKKLNVPVISVITEGAFSRDPLYNELKVRKNVPVTAKVTCLLTPEEISEKSIDELDQILDTAFDFDQFRWQRESGLEIHDATRADGLHRILYRCPHCQAEGQMEGRGVHLTCKACGKQYFLTPLGTLSAVDGKTEFEHIPDWFSWERDCVRAELLEDQYRLDVPVEIGVLLDHKALYMIGEGRLVHDKNGFVLTDESGSLHYTQGPASSYTLNADFYWYEIGDVIGIGDRNALYYCFPKVPCNVAKARLACEELFKILKNKP